MAIKGTLATFHVAKLGDTTVDDRRAVRNFLRENAGDMTMPPVEVLQKVFSDCMIDPSELLRAQRGLDLLDDLNGGVEWIMQDMARDKENYEAINVTRLKSTIDEMPESLLHNVAELKKLDEFQHVVPLAIRQILEAAKNAGSAEELKQVSLQGFQLMAKIANDPQVNLYPDLRVNEAHRDHIKDRSEKFADGYIYHRSIQDELNKVPFIEIYKRLNAEQKEQFKTMLYLLSEMHASIDTVYNMNWKQISLIRKTYSVLHECMSGYFEMV